MDIWDYFDRVERNLKSLSVYPDRPEAMFEAAEDDTKRGRIFANLPLTDVAYLRIYERIAIRGSVPQREAYSYNLIIDGAFAYGWERDPTHDPAVHEHEGSARLRRPSEPIPLLIALQLSWELISLHSEGVVRSADV